MENENIKFKGTIISKDDRVKLLEKEKNSLFNGA